MNAVVAPLSARRLLLEGRVQGVGFRPFVYRLAHDHGLRGWVLNGMGRVEIHIEGDAMAVDRFADEVVALAPPLAEPRLVENACTGVARHSEFSIRASDAAGAPEVHVPPDQFLCDDCLAELTDPAARRHRYPFINCTQCGPRYTLIRAMPYDRPNTTMAGFPLCPACNEEYLSPLDRRFHAEPLACPRCGPTIQWHQGQTMVTGDRALQRCLMALKRGGIVAVRGIGGYHLMCDPRSDVAVATLRERKQRPHKPLAIMVPQVGEDGLDAARELAELTSVQAAALVHPRRPIVLASMRPDAALSPLIAPDLDEVGLMLPYSPLHHLLLGEFGRPLVATSGNVSGEPVITAIEDAEARLSRIADGFLHHDRPICRPADDPVMREIAGQMRPLRIGRGNAPLELELPRPVTVPTLAVGAFLKNTVALAWGRRVVVSPHIGDLDTPRGRDVFEAVAADLQRLYGVRAERICCDAHPGYPNTRWAARLDLPLIPVHHHHAHAAAVAGEFAVSAPLLCLAWDGTGLGPDGTIWGSELLLGTPGDWQRVGALRPFRLPGGERAAREGWRAALALCWETDTPWPAGQDYASPLLRQAWERGVNCPLTTSAGRLFDGAAALLGVRAVSSFEGQAPMALEALARTATPAPAVRLPVAGRDGISAIDWAPLLSILMSDAESVATRAWQFHDALAGAMAEQVRGQAARSGVEQVGLAGGVFQNRLLTELLVARLKAQGMRVCLPVQLPVNDAAISYGQIIEAAATDTRQSR